MSLVPAEVGADPSTSTPEERAEYLRRVPFGSRYLTEQDDVFAHNAWDHVVPPPEWEEEAKEKLRFHRAHQVETEKKDAFNARPAYYWDKFYIVNKANFFKNRNWLRLEFPELLECAKFDAGPKTVVEIGCGAGNTVFPLLTVNENPQLVLHACDYSARAVEVVKRNPLYPVPPHGKGILHASVWDLTTPPVPSQSQAGPSSMPMSATDEERVSSLPEGIQPNSVDIATLIFVMSALHPSEWQRAIANVYKMLKPGGMAFIRDYGRYDLAQLRIKKGRMLEENFYIRGDGTRVYFFDAGELSEMLTGDRNAYQTEDITEPTVSSDDLTEAAAQALDSPMPGTPAETETKFSIDERSGVKIETGKPRSTRFLPPGKPIMGKEDLPPRVDYPIHETPNIEDAEAGERANPFTTPHEDLGVPSMPLFRIQQLGVDRRLMVNRKEMKKMYRIWMQVKAYKTHSTNSNPLMTTVAKPVQTAENIGGAVLTPSSALNNDPWQSQSEGPVAPEFLGRLIPARAVARSQEPFITLTYAQTLDAKIAGPGGQQVKISGPESMLMTHCLSSRFQVRLLPEAFHNLSPRPVILDPTLRLPPTARILTTLHDPEVHNAKAPFLLCREDLDMDAQKRKKRLVEAGAKVIEVPMSDGRMDLADLPRILQQLGIRTVMVEGGATVIRSFMDARRPKWAEKGLSADGQGGRPLVDLIVVTTAPTYIGDGVGIEPALTEKQVTSSENNGAPRDKLRFLHAHTEAFGHDCVMALTQAPVEVDGHEDL